ncbi:uncharacterized protein LOC126972792 [Leptidea sinapis]|uniref:SEFIR domain-containing protein n=1 Tax=Leptidea sinapis TaxID=189913 RepID=A0A5E4QWA3_9NEOP|nr:uncharacterized protein LOC126972792 [Leptidea sinapis]XP_050675801.1 uncharacterized protein LOC126972792 [Leptidea sinapis]VVD02022.1 unnamed protein product [Leptidea sinapis]
MESLFTILFCLHMVKNSVSLDQSNLRYQLCENNTKLSRSCTTQILGTGHSDNETCKVEYIAPNSSSCSEFRPIDDTNNAQIGGVSLSPYILPVEHHDDHSFYSVNYTVLNITFRNIKWKTMKFRFQKYNNIQESHCRNIVISNDVKINDESVLYYDCYWSLTDANYNGQGLMLDFEASDDVIVNRGQYLFNIPSAQMLSPTISAKDWKPFIYVEIFKSSMTLHIMPPPSHLTITTYQVDVMKMCGNTSKCHNVVKTKMIELKNTSEEVTYDHSLLIQSGSYYFVVTPIDDKCKTGVYACQYVESPRMYINPDDSEPLTTQICIASLAAIILSIVFVYYVALVIVRRYWCREFGHELIPPPRILIVYPTANRLHAECVASLVSYLRAEYGFDISYDGDIKNTSHGDPYVWAEEAFQLATHLVYIVGPAENTNLYNNIYDKPIITAHKDVDNVILSRLRQSRGKRVRKEVMNIFFEHSDGEIPIETKQDKHFFLIKDWQKFINHLSKNLPPKTQIMRTEKGKCFLEDLSRAKKLLSNCRGEHVVKFDKGCYEKKTVV